jgi:hypothetical protein
LRVGEPEHRLGVGTCDRAGLGHSLLELPLDAFEQLRVRACVDFPP